MIVCKCGMLPYDEHVSVPEAGEHLVLAGRMMDKSTSGVVPAVVHHVAGLLSGVADCSSVQRLCASPAFSLRGRASMK